jgi:hypothetical protein
VGLGWGVAVGSVVPAFHDAEVELALRGIELPNEMVQAEQELARHIIEHEYPNDPEWQAELQKNFKNCF